MSDSPPRSADKDAICVVIPAYNAARFLPDTLASVQSQEFANWRAIVVDDGSTDDTCSIARQFAVAEPRLEVVTQANGGVAAARNRGLAYAGESEFVLFLDGDDMLEPRALEALYNCLAANPELNAAHGTATYIDACGESIRRGEAEAWTRQRHRIAGKRLLECSQTEPTTFEMLAYKPYVITPGSCLVRTSALLATGGFDARLKNAEDYNFWIRLSASGGIGFVDEVIIRYRIHSGGKSRNPRLMARRDAIARAQVLVVPGLTESQRQLIYRGYRLKQRSEARDRLAQAIADARRFRPMAAAKEAARATKSMIRAAVGLPGWALRETE